MEELDDAASWEERQEDLDAYAAELEAAGRHALHGITELTISADGRFGIRRHEQDARPLRRRDLLRFLAQPEPPDATTTTTITGGRHDG